MNVDFLLLPTLLLSVSNHRRQDAATRSRLADSDDWTLWLEQGVVTCLSSLNSGILAVVLLFRACYYIGWCTTSLYLNTLIPWGKGIRTGNSNLTFAKMEKASQKASHPFRPFKINDCLMKVLSASQIIGFSMQN